MLSVLESSSSLRESSLFLAALAAADWRFCLRSRAEKMKTKAITDARRMDASAISDAMPAVGEDNGDNDCDDA